MRNTTARTYPESDAMEVAEVKNRKVLSKKQIDESIRFADGAFAAAGHKVDRHEVRADARRALKGDITYDEAIRRAAARAKK